MMRRGSAIFAAMLLLAARTPTSAQEPIEDFPAHMVESTRGRCEDVRKAHETHFARFGSPPILEILAP